ncbi:hypothetical protein [Bacteroides sp.]|uniref:hypothetical protein n=1 Tax=Bacteroides sp. TaxID=29523 RepID=UPI00262F8702|nr:hypothetical protein [Bacteroides sp.]MDD3040063.1 hypothetical protein [Bacteroides sp.]
MNPVAEDILMHYGMKQRSGRYPWGSGGSPYQHSGDFLSRVEELQKQGLSEKQVSETMKLSTTDLRMQVRVAKHERRNLEAARAKSLREDGKSLSEVAQIMGYNNDSSVRALLNENTSVKKNMAVTTADILKKELETKEMLDVGVGVEKVLGVSSSTLKESLFLLGTEGYNLYGIGVQTGPGKQTITSVLCKSDVEYKDVYANMANVQMVQNYHSVDGGKTFDKREAPASLDSKRVHIRYGDQGGTDKDGVIELRRGVSDLNLGNSHYAQVRILVDGTHYLKGMAMYSDDMPPGADIVFNTNKKTGVDKMKVLKPIKEDPDNPFGAYIKANGQSYYDDPKGKYTDPLTGRKQSLSPINKLKEEGDWDSMSKNLSSQFLSKQPLALIKKQLDLTHADARSEFDEICSLTNPTLKKKLLLDFANECDSATVHLKAAALPRQKTQVLLPLTSIKSTEIYAPNFENGEKIALVRYPHGGTFEIPVLTVNNKNKAAKNILGNVMDAVGIHPSVAEQLSGADFDGDQAVCIPISAKAQIQSRQPLKGLKDFNAKDEYSVPEGNPDKVKLMTKANTQKQMGTISNLITDMTLIGAPDDEIVRAVKHSMVVIDAEKHKLDYKKSEKDNGIAELKTKYQGYINAEGKQVGGASTLLSRRKQTTAVLERQGSGRIDPETGEVSYKTSGRTYIDKKTGAILPATTKVSIMINTPDARTLSSGTLPENAYADHANRMKALANEARREYRAAGNIKYSATSKATYQTEVDHLTAQLNVALMNAPRERRAQIVANSTVKAKIQSNPDMDKKEIRKAKQQALYDARANVGASGKENRIQINDREWEAIQAGAISDTQLTQILRYTDQDALRQRATPKTMTQLSDAQINKIKLMSASGNYTNSEIARAIGKSTSSVSKYTN